MSNVCLQNRINKYLNVYTFLKIYQTYSWKNSWLVCILYFLWNVWVAPNSTRNLNSTCKPYSSRLWVGLLAHAHCDHCPLHWLQLLLVTSCNYVAETTKMELAALVALTLLLGALILLVAVAVRKQNVETDEPEQTAESVGKNSVS